MGIGGHRLALYQIKAHREAHVCQMPCGHKAVAAVVALAAEDRGAFCLRNRTQRKPGRCRARVFHHLPVGKARRVRPLLQLLHFGRRYLVHSRFPLTARAGCVCPAPGAESFH